MEIWNLVFTELYQDEDGNQSPLESKNVDTGMGLERITMVCQGAASTFETDLLKPILDKVSEMSGVPYKKSEKTDISLRIITDHARCVSFLISDGVIPGNEGRSYVLRMILRRALRHGKILGMELPFLYKLADTVIETYRGAYPDLVKNRSKIIEVIKNEEERFGATLERGYRLLDEFIENKRDIDGESAFKLYDTYGFPFELTKEIALENGLKIDENEFKAEMSKQKERAKAAAVKISVTGDIKYAKVENETGSTEFAGYELNECRSKVLALIEGDGYIDVVLDKTPFYAECGGQTGDSGFIFNEYLKAEVLTTFKVNKLFVHRCSIINGEIRIGDEVTAQINSARRAEIRLHHTSAHLLQAALVKVLGDEVKQAGSLVEENRMRFDFTFSRAMTRNEIQKTESIINKWIAQRLPVHTDIMGIEEARLTGATALFGEKYEDTVRVVSIGGEDCKSVSKEFCAGTHARNTGDLRLIKIVSESAISAGTRRIEAVVSEAAIEYLNNKVRVSDGLEAKFKVHTDEVIERVEKLAEENRELQKQLEHAKAEIARSRILSLISKAQSINGGKLFVLKVDDLDTSGVKTGIEILSNKLGESIVILANDKTVAVKISDGFVKKGISAGKIAGEISKLTGANGGGRPNFAQGGIKDSSRLEEILSKTAEDLSAVI